MVSFQASGNTNLDLAKQEWDSKGELAASAGLLPFVVTFNERNVAVDGEIGEALDEAAGLRPFDFERVEFFVLGETENDARIVGRKIAAAAYFETSLL